MYNSMLCGATILKGVSLLIQMSILTAQPVRQGIIVKDTVFHDVTPLPSMIRSVESMYMHHWRS